MHFLKQNCYEETQFTIKYSRFCSHLHAISPSSYLIRYNRPQGVRQTKRSLSSTGVRLPHQVVLNRLLWQWCTFPYGPQEHVCVFKTALTFVDSVGELWGPLLQGRNILVVPRDVTKDPERLLHVLEEHKVWTNLPITPCPDRLLLSNESCIFMSL